MVRSFDKELAKYRIKFPSAMSVGAYLPFIEDKGDLTSKMVEAVKEDRELIFVKQGKKYVSEFKDGKA